MGLIAPALPDVDIDRWRALPRPERTRILAQHGAQFGFGTPKAICGLYAAKIALHRSYEHRTDRKRRDDRAGPLHPAAGAAVGGGTVTTVAVVVMVLFHLFILTAIPLGVPLEWNIVMIFGAIYLFGEYAPLHLGDTQYPVLVAAVFAAVAAVVIYGNLRPSKVSFLPAMRYYAGNWPTSVWLFAEGAEQKYADLVPKAAQLPHRQLAVL